MAGGTRFPDALEAAFKSSSLSKQFKRPKSLKPPPAGLKNHPATNAIKILKAKQIPPAVMAAAKASWGGGKGGASAKGGKSGASGKSAGGKSAGGMGKRDVDGDILMPRDVEEKILMARAAEPFKMPSMPKMPSMGQMKDTANTVGGMAQQGMGFAQGLPDLINRFKHMKRDLNDEELLLVARAAKGTMKFKKPTSGQIHGAVDIGHGAIGLAEHVGQAVNSFRPQPPPQKRDAQDSSVPDPSGGQGDQAAAPASDVSVASEAQLQMEPPPKPQGKPHHKKKKHHHKNKGVKKSKCSKSGKSSSKIAQRDAEPLDGDLNDLLIARDAMDFDAEDLLLARDAEADYDDDAFGLYARDAEAYDFDGDLDELFARDAEAEAIADPDAWAYADGYELGELLARETEAEAEASKKFTAENVDGLAELLQGNRAAAHAVAKALNADPKLAKYAEELDRDFGDGSNTDSKKDKKKG